MVLLDGYEDALIGFATPPNLGVKIAVYDYTKIAEIIMGDEGGTLGDAMDYIDFNIGTAWMGEGTPLIVDVCGAEEARERGIFK